MATVIQIKRSTSGNAPTTSDLQEAELGYSQDKSNDGANAILYIESVNNADSPVIHKVGGKYYTDLLDAATDTNTFSAIVKRDGSGNFAADTITANIVGTASGAEFADFANALSTTRYINLTGDATGSAAFDGTGNADISVTVGSNSIELGTDTTGEYVANITAGTGIEVTGYASESSDLTVTLADTAVTPTTYGGASDIPVLVIDQQGRITSASNISVSTSFTIAGDTGTDTLNGGDTFQIAGAAPGISTAATDNTITVTNTGVTEVSVDGHGIVASVGTGNVQLAFTGVGEISSAGHGIVASAGTGNISLAFTGVGAVAGTTNEIEVSASTGNVTIGLTNDVTIQNDLTVSGNLYVNGTAVTVNTTSLSINDSLIHLANNNTSSDVVDIGFEGHYFDATFGQRHAGFFRDASDSGKFKLFANVEAELEGVTTIDTENAGFTIATLVANLEGGTVSGLTAAIGVSDGGTGRTTLTANAVLYGDGTNAVGLATGSAGEVLQLNADGLVVFGNLDGGTY